jgi:hypothetical protein
VQSIQLSKAACRTEDEIVGERRDFSQIKDEDVLTLFVDDDLGDPVCQFSTLHPTSLSSCGENMSDA